MAEASDYDLIKRFCKGDENAFAELESRHRRMIYNFIYRMAGNAEAADDLFQETWLKVIRAAHTYRPRAKFTTWALQIARNATLDHFKRSGIRRHASLDAPTGDDDAGIGAMLPSGTASPDDASLFAEMREEVQQGIERLSQNQKEALVLRVYHQLSYSEIADLLDTPEGTAKYWVHEAIKALTEHLERKGLTNDLSDTA